MISKKLLYFSLIIFSAFSADLLIFSYNRDMQLYAYLESIEKYISGIDSIWVLYRTTTKSFEEGYSIVKRKFPNVKFIKQKNAPHDFKRLVLDITYNKGSSKYIVFGIDDLIMKDYVEIKECTNLMSKYNAYAFFLRLGMNYNWCYPAECFQEIPNYKEVEKNICLWSFKDGKYDFGYPNDLSMTIYNKDEIKKDLYSMTYQTPNTFEGSWYSIASFDKLGLTFKKSKLVNVPINRVQNENTNVHMDAYSTEELSEIFRNGKKIDFSDLHQIDNEACCIEWEPKFIDLN